MTVIKLHRKGRHQIAKYIIEAANIRTDDFIVPLLIQAACYLSAGIDQFLEINKAV